MDDLSLVRIYRGLPVTEPVILHEWHTQALNRVVRGTLVEAAVMATKFGIPGLAKAESQHEQEVAVQNWLYDIAKIYKETRK